jgi:hypothetical protein
VTEETRQAAAAFASAYLRMLVDLFVRAAHNPGGSTASDESLDAALKVTKQDLTRVVGPKHPFVEHDAFEDILHEELFREGPTGEPPRRTPEALTQAIASFSARIACPEQQWRFAVPLSWGGAPRLGPFDHRSLELRTEGEVPRAVLTGVFEGPLLVDDALRAAESAALELFGACVALGLATIAEAPIQREFFELGATVRLDLEPARSSFERRAPWRLMRVANEVRFGRGPLTKPTDLEKREEDQGVPARTVRLLTRLFGGNSARHVELRNACRLFLEAYMAADHGTSVLYGFLCLEAILLDPHSKSEVLARLAEAVAYRVGRSAKHRQDVRKFVKALYDDRSTYVHTGSVQPRDDEAERWHKLLASTLALEIGELEE